MRGRTRRLTEWLEKGLLSGILCAAFGHSWLLSSACFFVISSAFLVSAASRVCIIAGSHFSVSFVACVVRRSDELVFLATGQVESGRSGIIG